MQIESKSGQLELEDEGEKERVVELQVLSRKRLEVVWAL